MAVKKDTKVTPTRVPVSNINQFVRVPGMPPTALAQALQHWDEVWTHEYTVSDPETPGEHRTVREVLFSTEKGQFSIPVSEQLYEVALYTRATKRFGDWMRDNAGKPGTRPFGA